MLSRFLVVVATLAYPLVVYFGFGRASPVFVALVLAGLLVLRAWVAREAVWLVASAGAGMLAIASLGESWLPLKLYPVMVSALLLGVFGASLLKPPTVIERIARIRDPQLPLRAVAYARNVTLVWCGFFACNGLLALATVLWGSDESWLLYNGLLAYLLMGTVFGAEWLVRRRVRARIASDAAHG